MLSGSAIRLLLLVYRPDGYAGTQEKFQVCYDVVHASMIIRSGFAS